MKNLMRWTLAGALGMFLIAPFAGCGDTGTEVVKDAEKAAAGAGEAIQEGAAEAGEAIKEGAAQAGDAMSKLGEQAVAFLTPLKEQFSGLEDMVSDPAKLKESVSNMITSIEDKMGSIELPESVTKTLDAAKEKLVELRDYLNEEADEAGITEKVKAVMDSIKGGLGLN